MTALVDVSAAECQQPQPASSDVVTSSSHDVISPPPNIDYVDDDVINAAAVVCPGSRVSFFILSSRFFYNSRTVREVCLARRLSVSG